MYLLMSGFRCHPKPHLGSQRLFPSTDYACYNEVFGVDLVARRLLARDRLLKLDELPVEVTLLKGPACASWRMIARDLARSRGSIFRRRILIASKPPHSFSICFTKRSGRPRSNETKIPYSFCNRCTLAASINSWSSGTSSPPRTSHHGRQPRSRTGAATPAMSSAPRLLFPVCRCPPS